MPPRARTPHLEWRVLAKSVLSFYCFFQHCNGGPKGPQAVPKVSHKSAKGLQNGDKREVRAVPESAPARSSHKKGLMCNPYIICYVSSTSALLEKVTFSLQWALQNEGKSGLRPRSRKNVKKTGRSAPKWRRRVPHGSPRVAQGLQNDAQNLF